MFEEVLLEEKNFIPDHLLVMNEKYFSVHFIAFQFN
jgi:hypothetical protein